MNNHGKINIGLFFKGGFTILEVIVAINISFLLLTFIVSFYLFTYRLSSSIGTKISTYNNLNNFLYRVEERLQHADKFYIESKTNQLLIVINDSDSITASDSLLNFSNIFLVNSFDRFSIEILTDESEVIEYSVPAEEGRSAFSEQAVINSGDINSVQFNIAVMGKVFSSFFIRGRNSAIGFRNIGE
jgi:hypothetical protein